MKLLSKIALSLFTVGTLASCGVYTDGYGYNDGYYNNNRNPYYDGGYYMNNVYYSPNYNYYGPGGYWGMMATTTEEVFPIIMMVEDPTSIIITEEKYT